MNVLLESIIYFHLWWMCSRLYQRWCCIALYHRNNNSVRKKNSFSGLSTVREHIFCRFQRGFEIKRFVLLVFLSTSLSMCDPSSPARALGPAEAPGTGARVGRLRTEQLAPSAAVAVSSTAGIWPPLLAASRPPSRKVYFLHRKDRGQERGENKDPKLKSQITL